MNRNHRLIFHMSMYVGLGLTSLSLYVDHPDDRVWIAIGCFVVTFIQLLRYRIFHMAVLQVPGLLLLGVQWATVVGIQVVDGTFLPQVFFFILITEVAFRSPVAFSLPFSLLCYAGFVFGVSVHMDFPPFHEIEFVIPRFLEYALFWGFSYTSRTVIFQKSQLNHAFAKLKETNLKLEEKTLMEERIRLSREIHDTIGHALSAAVVGIESGKQLLLHGKKDQATDQLDQTRSQIKKSLEETRWSVHTLYEQKSFINFQKSLTTLMNETIDQTGVTIDDSLQQDLPTLSTQQELTLYRALQEGLTNGIRHGGSTHFHFSLKAEGNEIQFDLRDNGTLPKNVQFGFGLMSMSERVKWIDGTLYLKRTEDSGAHLHIRLPIQHLPNDQAIKGVSANEAH